MVLVNTVEFVGVYKMYLSLLAYLRPIFVNVMRFVKLIAGGNCKSWMFQSFNGVIVIGSLVFCLLAASSGYFYMFPAVQPMIQNVENNTSIGLGQSDENITSGGLRSECNVFDGRWVPDESYPLYNASECPFAEQGFNCLANGRKDRDYLKWRWKPNDCDILKFDVRKILEFLRGKRVVFVGDSLSRTQWESMICMLMTGVEDKTSVFEVNKHKITRRIRYLGVQFSSYNFSVDFYRSVFLVQPAQAPKRSPKRVKWTLKLDSIDDISKEWVNSDILIFNTGHWWVPSKLFNMGWYFQIGGNLKLGMPITGGFRTALDTWKSWLESNVNSSRTQVFFRTFESTHWSFTGSGARQKCKVTRQPLEKVKGRDRSPISDAIIDLVSNLSVPVTVLHVTPMGAFRSDAHVGTWSDIPIQDCSHWCLPGVPDMWNELLFSFLYGNHRE